jgi:putative PIN family toxin of toxin-antitoxin system
VLRAVVDVNVLVSALLRPDGAPARILRSWLDGAFELVASQELVEELLVVAARPRLARRLDPLAVDLLAERLRTESLMVDDLSFERVVARDPKDDYLVALARAGNAHALVTGDRHLLDLERVEPNAVTPRAFVDLLERIA